MRTVLTLLAFGTVMAAQTPPPANSPAAPAKAAGAPSSVLMKPAALNAQAPATFEATFTTTKGDIVIQVTRAWAPFGADRFYNLVKNGFFNDNAFFRVIPNFVVQFGMSSNPAIQRVWQNASIKDDPVKQPNGPGYVVFAATGMPNSRTTQLFINLGDNSRSLDSQGFAPFGKVTQGMEIVRAIYAGYGESPDQSRIGAQGKAYLEKNFPKLDYVKSATITSESAAAPAKK